jgi:hypothetical protein
VKSKPENFGKRRQSSPRHSHRGRAFLDRDSATASAFASAGALGIRPRLFDGASAPRMHSRPFWLGTRNLVVTAYIVVMEKTPSPEKAARLERQRLAAEDGSKAMQEILDAGVAVRANMARLRALRLAKEADGKVEPSQPGSMRSATPRRRRKPINAE